MRRAVLATVGALALALVGLVGVVAARTALVTSRQPVVSPVHVAVDAARVAGLLSHAISLPTVSSPDAEALDPAPFEALNRWLPEAFPALHAATEPESIGLARVFRWEGADPSLPPVLLMAHTDVVPVENEAAWSHDPFSGDIADGFIWGRGAIDMKAAMVGILEAANQLAAQGWRPRRTVYVALGPDEEVGGHQGHARVAAAFAQRGLRFAWVLDEGLPITDGIVPGLDAPAALVGVAEKGYLSVELLAEGTGGHSSMPPPQSAAGVVAAAVARVEASPFDGGVDGPVAGMLTWLGPEMRMPERLAFANLWLLGGVVEGQLAGKPNTHATLRTTIAVTQLQGSVQDNVLPQRARAVVNLRLHPRDSIASAMAHLEAAVDDPRVTIRPLEASLNGEPSPVSSTESAGWQTLTRSIREVRPDVVVAPGLMIGATDSRWYVPLADDVYRFHPVVLGPGDTDRIHGVDERLPVDDMADFVRFYRRVLENL